MTLVEEFFNQKIYKVKHIHSSDPEDYDIYIFVGGHYNSFINNLITKLEKNDYRGLTDEENKKLSHIIPNFRAKFGKINIGRTFFIRDLIFENDSINIIRMKISYYLNQIKSKASSHSTFEGEQYIGINHQHLWIQPHIIKYDELIKFINCLLGKNIEFTVRDLVHKLQIILDLESQKEIEELIRGIFSEKYKNKDFDKGINLFNNSGNEFYNINELINDEEFLAVLNYRFTVIGREYNKSLMIAANTYIKHPLYIVANPFSPIVNQSDKVVMDQESNQYSKILSDYGLIENNMIFLVTYNDFMNNYKGINQNDIASLYWDYQASEYSSNKNKIKLENESIKDLIEKIAITNNNLLLLSNNRKENPSKFKSFVNLNDDYLVNDVIIGINHINYPNNFDIDTLFNIFETSYSIPFVKFVVNDYHNNYKIYKPFLKKHSFKLKVIASWKNQQIISDIVYPSNKKYLVFKMLLKNKSEKTIEDYVSITLYENGYTIINFNLKKYVTIKEVKVDLEEVSEFINKLMKITESKILHLPESNLIFKGGYNSSITRTEILSIGLKTQLELDNKYKLTLNDINERLKTMYPFFYGSLKDNIMKVIYKKVNNFDSDFSIKNFINKLFEKNKRAFEGQKSTYLELIESIFLVDRIKSKELLDQFNPQESSETTKYHFLYGTDITITSEIDKFIINIENLHQIKHINFIHNLFNILFDPDFKIERESKNGKEIEKKGIEIELEEKPLIIEPEPQVDLGFDFDELGFEDLGLDVNIEEEFKKGEEQKEKEQEKIKEEEKAKGLIDYDIKKKGAQDVDLKFTNYMAQMREKADPGLYKVEESGASGKDDDGGQKWKYSRTCDSAQMRQPYIIPKENLDKIKDKKAITGYIKYRDNYYICPRIWDYKAEMPISVEEFTKNGLKSPYTNGKALPYDKRNKEFLGDKYTVIIRRPTSEPYWSKENVEKGWPEIFKNTGAEAFPGFTKPKNHPKNLCIPCCFLKEPEDYDPNTSEVQAFKKPVGNEVCDVQTDTNVQKTTADTKEFDDGSACKNENYIKADIAILDNCRYGQLPDNLNILLRNHQEILISSTTNSLHKYANCFLRRGVFSDKNSFLRSIASIKESISNNPITYKHLIDLIATNLKPELFMTLNQGALINIFKFNNNLPRNRSQIYFFSEFIKNNKECVSWLGLKDFELNSVDDLLNLQKDQLKLRKVKKLFTIFAAYYNFIKYCQDDKIIKKHEFFLDLIGRKLDWLFPEGVNILMFSKETNNIYCNPYVTEMEKPIIMLLFDSNGKFEPIFHIQSKASLEPVGVIQLNNDVNMSSKNLIFLKNHLKNQPININLLKDTQKRLPILKELVKIHLNNCSEFPNNNYGSYKLLPTSLNVYKQLKELARQGGDLSGLEPVSQITSPLHTTEFIITSNKMVFPVRPSSIILSLPVYDGLEYFDLIEIKKSDKILEYLTLFNNKTNNNLSYKPARLVVTELDPDTVIGIILENDGLIPIYPTSIENMLEKGDSLGLKLDIIVKNIYYEADYKIYDNQILKDDRIGYLEEYQKFENLYQHFKYEVSSVLGESKYSAYRKEILEFLNTPSIDLSITMSSIKTIIEKITNKILNITSKENKGKEIEKDKKYKLTSCNRLSQKKCEHHQFCSYDGKKGCQLNLETRFWTNLFITRLCESIIRNINERNLIISGKYKPSFFQEEGLRLTEDEIFLTNENFYLIKQIYKSSRYHQEVDIFETVESDSISDRIIKVPYKGLVDRTEDVSEKTLTQDTGTSTTGIEITDLMGEKKKLKNVYATVFDKDGKYRSQYNAGPCIFPYIYGNTKQLFFDCNKDKDEGQRCPIEVDKNRRALKWGFCPADPKETRKKNNITEIHAKATNEKGKIDKGFKSGKCIFPFRYHPSYDLSWECISTKHGKGQKWCATSLKTGKNVASELPIAADKDERIYQKKWEWESMYDSNKNFNDEFLRYNTRGYCPSDDLKIKDKGKDKGDDEITIETFNMNKCNQTDSKGGYSKNLLKRFAIKYLGFDEKDIEGKKKDILCQIINERLSNMKSRTDLAGKTLLDIYKKDPKLCEKGESGGGYYLGTLRKLASRYFGMDPDIAKDSSKKDLCDFITPILDKETIKINKNKPIEKVVLSNIYTKNPNYCEEGPRKGGYGLKELKEMGVKYFGIQESMNNKEDICKIIRDKLNDEKFNFIKNESIENTDMYSNIDDEYSFELFKKLKNVKSEKPYQKKTFKKLQKKSKSDSSISGSGSNSKEKKHSKKKF
jgi:hypothetical protein